MTASTHKPAGIWALVPAKQLDQAKSRLSDVLDSQMRKTLARAMFRDVLRTLTCASGLSGILVVTNDTEIALVADSFGATVISDPDEIGLNAAIAHGMRWLDAAHKDGVVVVPADIPFLTLPELNAVLAAMRFSPLVIAPAIRDGGTNILAVSPPSSLQPMFGTNSFARHVAAARAAGIEPITMNLEGAGHDIDVAADLVFTHTNNSASHTRACLGRLAPTNFPALVGSAKEVSVL